VGRAARAAIDDAGDAIVSWSEVRAVGGASVFTSRFDAAAASWSSAEQLTAGDNPIVAMSGSGGAMLAWLVPHGATGALWWSRAARIGDAWSTPAAMGRDTSVEMFDVAVNDDGVGLLVWSERPAPTTVPRIMASRFE
jgi:hypothetical protein